MEALGFKKPKKKITNIWRARLSTIKEFRASSRLVIGLKQKKDKNKPLEASDLRVFNKYYVISN